MREWERGGGGVEEERVEEERVEEGALTHYSHHS